VNVHADTTATVLLCDYAAVSDNKLNIIGGGWSYIWPLSDDPLSIFVAVSLSVPWVFANRDLTVRTELMTEDGEPFQVEGVDVAVEGTLRVGRPAPAREGAPLVVPFVLPFQIPLPSGGYVFVMRVDTEEVARTPFQVQQLTPT
jgi:hypothetical protein